MLVDVFSHWFLNCHDCQLSQILSCLMFDLCDYSINACGLRLICRIIRRSWPRDANHPHSCRFVIGLSYLTKRQPYVHVHFPTTGFYIFSAPVTALRCFYIFSSPVTALRCLGHFRNSLKADIELLRSPDTHTRTIASSPHYQTWLSYTHQSLA